MIYFGEIHLAGILFVVFPSLTRGLVFVRSAHVLRITLLKIQEFHPEHREAVVSLWNTVFPNPAPHNDPQQSIDQKTAINDGLFFVAIEDETVVGTILGGYDGHRGWIYSVAVSPDRQRQGIGTKLIRHAESVLIERGSPKINLQVRSDNAEVVAFYQTLGYRVEERIGMGKIVV